MSDFLDRLTSRSLAKTANLRPRLQPIFDVTPAIPEAPVSSTPQAHSKTAGEVVHQMRTVTDETVERRIVNETRATEITQVTEISKENVFEANPNPARETPPPRASEDLVPVRPASLAARESQPTLRHPALPPSPVQPPPSAITQVLQFLPERPPIPVSALNPPPFKSSPAIETRQQEPEPRSPDIEIHIGRVEVRAQFAAAPAKREVPKPKGPALTLDQYLEGRR